MYFLLTDSPYFDKFILINFNVVIKIKTKACIKLTLKLILNISLFVKACGTEI